MGDATRVPIPTEVSAMHLVLLIVVPTVAIMVSGYLLIGPPGHRHPIPWPMPFPQRLVLIVALTAGVIGTVYLAKH
jgi:hypothetical protein